VAVRVRDAIAAGDLRHQNLTLASASAVLFSGIWTQSFVKSPRERTERRPPIASISPTANGFCERSWSSSRISSTSLSSSVTGTTSPLSCLLHALLLEHVDALLLPLLQRLVWVQDGKLGRVARRPH